MKPASPSSRLLRLSLAALAGLSVWVWALHRQIDEQAGRTASLAAELERARQHLLDTEARLASALSRLASAPVVSTPTRPHVSSTKDETREPDAPESPGGPGFPAGMLDHPAMQTMMAAATKGALDRRYGPLFRKLQLDPARTDRLKELLTERQMSSLDVVRAAQAQGLGAAEIDALLANSGTDIDANVRLLLGQPGYEQFQDYEKNIGAYGVLESMERRLGSNNPPLSETQSAELLRIVSQTSSESPMSADMADDPMLRVMQAMGGGPPTMSALGRPRITEQTIEAARRVLDESQLDVLRQLRAEQQTRLDAMRAMGGVPFGSP